MEKEKGGVGEGEDRCLLEIAGGRWHVGDEGISYERGGSWLVTGRGGGGRICIDVFLESEGERNEGKKP